MAAAFAREHGREHLRVLSAGSAPGEHLNSAVVKVMNEVGLDISLEQPQRLTDEMARDADVVVTMGCGDACPIFPGKRYVDWTVRDPAGLPLEEVRPIRDEIDARVRALLDELLSDRPAP